MPDSSTAQSPPLPSLPEASAPRRRIRTYSLLTTLLAVLAAAAAAYALWRLDATRDRLDEINGIVRSLEADRTALQAQLDALAERESRSERELADRLDELEALPQQVADLNRTVEALHGRNEGPQRAWSRAQALFLMEIAQRSLVLERDVATAIAALESADARLASLHDPALAQVRQELATELQALRTTRVLDTAGLLARLSAAEDAAGRLPMAGSVAVERREDSAADLPEGIFARARAIVSRSLANLVRVRDVDERRFGIVTADEQLMRRQHLQMLLFAARNAVVRHDQAAYTSALTSARRWLSDAFDLDAPATQALLKEIELMEAIEIEPKLPSIGKSAASLQRLARPSAPES